MIDEVLQQRISVIVPDEISVDVDGDDEAAWASVFVSDALAKMGLTFSYSETDPYRTELRFVGIEQATERGNEYSIKEAVDSSTDGDVRGEDGSRERIQATRSVYRRR